MKFDQAINEGYERYTDEYPNMIPVSADLLKKAREIVKTALGTTTYGENEDLMRLYHHTYMDLDKAIRDAGIKDEDFEDLEGVTDETQQEGEDFDDVNASDLSKALSLGKQLKSPEVAQATQELHGKVAQKIKDEASKLS